MRSFEAWPRDESILVSTELSSLMIKSRSAKASEYDKNVALALSGYHIFYGKAFDVLREQAVQGLIHSLDRCCSYTRGIIAEAGWP